MKNTLIYYLLFLLLASFVSLLLSSCRQGKGSARTAAAGKEADAGSLYQFTGGWHGQEGDTLRLSRCALACPCKISLS